MPGQFTRRRLLALAASSGLGTSLAGRGRATALPGQDEVDWYEREFRNYTKTQEAPAEQSSEPDFMRRWQRRSQQNTAEYVERTVAEPGWRSHANLCATWGEQCAGDPALYRDVDARDFYDTVGERQRVAFYDRQGARLSGHVWTPVGSWPTEARPGVVITNGSVQAPEPPYWWAAQALVEAGYVVLTYDPRGQGRSDSATPDGEPGSNANAEVFVSNQVDAVDFFRSTPSTPYAPNDEFDRDDGAPVEPHNPASDLLDRDRVGIAGHSAGAIGASIVQGLGSRPGENWPGSGTDTNPVQAVVAWDNLGSSEDVTSRRPDHQVNDLAQVLGGVPQADVTPRVPAMGQSADYFLTPRPHERPPDPDAKATGYATWRDAGVPAYQLVVRGGTHYEWSRVPTFPATAWEFGNALAEHYTVAWFDRWLKESGESGYDDADDRLLADDQWCDHLSFTYRSKRDFPDRDGTVHTSENVRGECDVS